MIRSITLRNFGCFDDNDYTLEFDRLSVIVGPNNSGKSTFFKGCNFVRRIGFTGGQIQWSAPGFYSLNSYRDSVYNHDEARELRITTRYQINGNNFVSDCGFIGNNMSVNSFTMGDSSSVPLSTTSHKDVANTVWYVSPDRISIPYSMAVGVQTDTMQSLHPTGNNVIDFLIQQYTSRHPQFSYAESWFKRIDPDMNLLSMPLSGNQVSAVTSRDDGTYQTNVNINLQGSGIQNAASIISAVVFSPDNSTIIIEEPENFLQYSSVEALLDLFNDVIAKTNKQIILITHSWDVLTTYVNDLGNGISRTGPAVITNGDTFRMSTIRRGLPNNKIEQYDLRDKNIGTVWDDLAKLLENPDTQS